MAHARSEAQSLEVRVELRDLDSTGHPARRVVRDREHLGVHAGHLYAVPCFTRDTNGARAGDGADEARAIHGARFNPVLAWSDLLEAERPALETRGDEPVAAVQANFDPLQIRVHI